MTHSTWNPQTDPDCWCNRPNHPDIPEPKTGPDGDMYGPDDELIEDYCDYVQRVNTHLSEHPPAEPPGFFLIPCDATPRHDPEYIPVFHDVYEPNCRACYIDMLVKQHDGCEHSHHKAWRRWRITRWALGWGYEHGLVKGYGNQHNAYCKGCVVGVSWGRSAWFNDRHAR